MTRSAPRAGSSLTVDSLRAGYGSVMVLHGLSFSVEAGECVGIRGPNGAGKTTLLKALAGTLPTKEGRVLLDGAAIHRDPPHRRVRKGLALVPEGRQIIGSLPVRGDLDITILSRGRARRDEIHQQRLENVYELFPILRERQTQAGSSLSGGQQQMLAIGRALMTDPDVLLLDEPSQGLAEAVVDEVATALQALRSRVTMVVVEQNAELLSAVSHRVLSLRVGRMVDREQVESEVRSERLSPPLPQDGTDAGDEAQLGRTCPPCCRAHQVESGESMGIIHQLRCEEHEIRESKPPDPSRPNVACAGLPQGEFLATGKARTDSIRLASTALAIAVGS